MIVRPKETLRTLLGENRGARFTLPRELITTDRILQRWAVVSGTGLPSDEWDDLPRAKPPPLPDDIAVDVDLIICKSPHRTQRVIRRWYLTPEPVDVIARNLGMSPRNVYRALSVCLEFMRWRFEGSCNPDLVALVRAVEP